MFLKKIWQNYISSGLDLKLISEIDIEKIKFINTFSLVGVCSTLIYAVVNILNNSIILGLLEIFLSLLAVLNVILLRRSHNPQIASLVILILMLLVLTALLISGGIAKTGFLWFYTFPLLAFFLMGRKKGGFFVLSLYLITVGCYFLYTWGLLPDFKYNFTEIRQLLSSFTAVVLLVFFYEKIRSDNYKIIKENEKQLILKNIFEEQFKEAGIIQQAFVPQTKSNDHYEITGFYRPAMEIGGDYLDFFNLRDGSTGIVIGDVAGKGIPAALIMVKIRTIVKIISRLKIINPSKMLDFANRILLKEAQDHLYVTLLYLVLDQNGRKIKFANAGHFPLAHFSKKDQKIREIGKVSYPIGIEPKKDQYQDEELMVARGDILVLFTDGIIEMKNKQAEFYGKDRLFSMVGKFASLAVTEIRDNLNLDFESFLDGNLPGDDIAFVVIKIK